VDDPYHLQRFVNAQDPIYRRVCQELKAGCKMTHWMWFIFPQLAGLGHSATARRFAISSRAEAKAYLDHPVLGARLRECVRLTNGVGGRTASEVFGNIDEMKFHSSLTLFANVTADNAEFNGALQKYFGGEPDRPTLDRL
jgi:uncharacterized protein (DUF1810 family)